MSQYSHVKYTQSPTPSVVSGYSSASRLHSPLPPPANHRRDCLSATTKSYKYLRRLLKFNQMDFEFALWQMVYLFVAPQKVYRNFNYRKQTKSQFARDDPAFLVLLVVCLCGEFYAQPPKGRERIFTSDGVPSFTLSKNNKSVNSSILTSKTNLFHHLPIRLLLNSNPYFLFLDV